MDTEIVIYLLLGQLVMLTGIFFRMGGFKASIDDMKRRLDTLESIVIHNTNHKQEHQT